MVISLCSYYQYFPTRLIDLPFLKFVHSGHADTSCLCMTNIDLIAMNLSWNKDLWLFE